MAEIQLGQIAITAIVSLVSGGAMGALINNYYAWRRTRIQPVTYRIGTDVKTGSLDPNAEFVLKVSVKHGNRNHAYERLIIVNIDLANAGSNDFVEFPFGFALSNGDRVIMCETQAPDRHNPIENVTAPTPLKPLSEIDFICRPFNRGKHYSLTFYVEPGEGATTCGPIVPSSPLAVDFVNTRTFVNLTPEQIEYVILAMTRTIPFGHLYLRAMKTLFPRRFGQ